VALIYVNDDFGKGGVDGFKARAAKYGIETAAEEKYARGDLDFTSQLSHIQSSGGDMLVDWSRYAEGALICKQMSQMGIKLLHFGSDGQAHPKFLQLAGATAEGMYYPTHFSVATASEIPTAQVFIKKIRKTYGKDPDYVHAEAYDAAAAALLAMERAGKAEREPVRDALRTVSFDGTRGHFSFDKKGDPNLMTHIVLVRGGKETNGRKAA